MKLSELIVKKGYKIDPKADWEMLDSVYGYIRSTYFNYKNPCLELFEYRNCKYCGTKDNHYFMLVEANVDEDNNVILHPDTIGIADASFSKYKHWGNAERINEIHLGEKINSCITAFNGINAKAIISYSSTLLDHVYFEGFQPLDHVDYIYFPNIDFPKLRDKDVKVKVVNGFFIKDYTGVETKQDNKYIAYLEKSVKYFLPYLDKMPEIFDYLINKILINYEQIYDLINQYNDNEIVKNKLINYRDTNFSLEYENEKENKLTYLDLEDCLEIAGYYESLSQTQFLPLPYCVFKGVNKTYKNSKGNEYIIKDILDLFNRIFGRYVLYSKDIIQRYNNYYLSDNKTKLEGFTNKELEDLIWKYYIPKPFYKKAVVVYDTWWVVDDNMYLLNKEWLKLFYDTVKAHPTIDYKKCEDVKPIKDKNYFAREYQLPDELMRCFVKAVDISSSSDRFIDLIRDLIENKIDMLM